MTTNVFKVFQLSFSNYPNLLSINCRHFVFEFRLMENGPPQANFEVQYYSGDKFTFSASKGTWVSNIPNLSDPTHHPDFRSWLIERERVENLEKMMEELERDEDRKRLPGKR